MNFKTLRPIAAALVVTSLASTVSAETLGEHPAVRVASTWNARRIDTNAFIAGHPAGTQLNGAAATGTVPPVPTSRAAPGPDLQVVGIVSNPPNPAVGAAVTFVVSVTNRGTDPAAAGTTTRVTVGTTTLNNSNSPAIAAGATVNVTIPGSWAASRCA